MNRRHPARRRIRDSCPRNPGLKSTWYRAPAWIFRRSRIEVKEIDEKYVKWKSEQIGFYLTKSDIIQEQQMIIRWQMMSLAKQSGFS